MLREAVSKRLSQLKDRGMATPIVNEVAMPAEVLSVNGFKLPTLDSFQPEAIGDFLKGLSSLPAFAYGKAAGAIAGQWYAVKYPKAMTDAVPVVVGLGRLGSINTRAIEKVRDVTFRAMEKVPDMTFRDILRVDRVDFNSAYYCNEVASGARDRAKTLGPPWPLDTIWGWFCDIFVYTAFYAGWYAGGWVLNVLWDTYVQVQIDNVAASVAIVVGDANAKVNAQVQKIQDGVNSVIQDANTKINDQIGAIQDAVNLRLVDLYNMWGLPANIVPTPLHVRNAISTGFEFQSYGNTTAYWIAIGQ